MSGNQLPGLHFAGRTVHPVIVPGRRPPANPLLTDDGRMGAGRNQSQPDYHVPRTGAAQNHRTWPPVRLRTVSDAHWVHSTENQVELLGRRGGRSGALLPHSGCGRQRPRNRSGEPGVLQVSPLADGKKILKVDADLKLSDRPRPTALSARVAVRRGLNRRKRGSPAGKRSRKFNRVVREAPSHSVQVQTLDLATGTRPILSIRSRPPNSAKHCKLRQVHLSRRHHVRVQRMDRRDVTFHD
jgi:hypothetical protein